MNIAKAKQLSFASKNMNVRVLTDISFETRVVSWSSSEIIGKAGEAIDIHLCGRLFGFGSSVWIPCFGG